MGEMHFLTRIHRNEWAGAEGKRRRSVEHSWRMDLCNLPHWFHFCSCKRANSTGFDLGGKGIVALDFVACMYYTLSK